MSLKKMLIGAVTAFCVVGISANAQDLVDCKNPAEWKQFSTTLKGEAQSGISKEKFWKGTKFVRVFAWFGNDNRIPEKGARRGLMLTRLAVVAPGAHVGDWEGDLVGTPGKA